MNEFPCMICQGGDIFSNQICDDCEADIAQLNELRDEMERIVRKNNNISGYHSHDIGDKIREEVGKIFNELMEFRIQGKERGKE